MAIEKTYRVFNFSQFPKEYQDAYYGKPGDDPPDDLPCVFHIADKDELAMAEDELCPRYRKLSLWLIEQGCAPGQRVVFEYGW